MYIKHLSVSSCGNGIGKVLKIIETHQEVSLGGGMMKLVDITDLKSVDRNIVRVRFSVPPPKLT